MTMYSNRLSESIPRLVAAISVTLAIWMSLLALSSLGRPIHNHAEQFPNLSSTKIPESIVLRAYGWPVILKSEVVSYGRIVTVTEYEYDPLRIEGFRLVGSSLIHSNMIRWFVILVFAFTGTLRASLGFRTGRSMSLSFFFMTMTYVAVFIWLGGMSSFDWTLLPLVLISFGLCCCIFEPLILAAKTMSWLRCNLRKNRGAALS